MAPQQLYLAPLPSKPNGAPSISRVLVSNRGEIAVRIIETCSKLGVETVAIYTDLDAEAPHVALASQSVFIGSSIPDPSTPDAPSPYLRGDEIIALALATGCDAIHPGYGYLSENAAFADKAVAAGLIFVGPASESIRTIGDKAASKAFLTKYAPTEVPLVPGYSGEDQKLETLVHAGKATGYPLLIKASAGGGGKGMRIVREEASLASELERAASESKRNFGDARLLLEKYVDEGKHIEVQIFGDKHGHVYSFFERECSVQRRHQKIIEECPSPALSEDQRERISASARKIGQLLHYEGAGTVEFIFDVRTGEFFFLEVNTRLQVEHPITEMTTGLDLVALQLYVAGGGDLSLLPEVTGVKQMGHAIEARLCAEDAFAEFAPRTGVIRLVVEGMQGAEGIRSDTGVQTGNEVTVFFDPMLAKLIVWAPTRPAAIHKLSTLLRSHICLGITTNQPFLLSCLSHPSFLSGAYTTAFIPSSISSLLTPLSEPHSTHLALAASLFLRQLRTHFAAEANTPLAKLPIAWSNNPEDVTRRPLEHLEISLPEGGFKGLKIELASTAAGAAFDPAGQKYGFRTWGDVEPLKGKKGVNMAVGNYYKGSASREGMEGRGKGEWGTGVDECENWDVGVRGVRVAQSGVGGKSWFHGYLRMSVGGKEETYFVATSEWEGTTGVSQSVWVHSREFGGGVQIRRRDLLTFAGELDKRVAGAADLGEGAKYLSSMPCRILEILALDGSSVKLGDSLLTMESMKTEIRLTAKADGVIKLHVVEGDICAEGKVLCEIVGVEEA